MDIHLHLVSMPLHDPLQPSAQLGYLHGHIARNLVGVAEVTSYSAHLEVLYRWKAEDMREAYFAHRLFGEELFLLACCYDFPILFERAYTAYLSFSAPDVHATRNEVAALSLAMRAYVHQDILPALRPNALNVVGFTTTFAQVFASIFAAREIAAHATVPFVFVFGGASVTMPEVREALRLWEVDGLVIQGSGEEPLEAVLRLAASMPKADDALLVLEAACIVNVSRIGQPSRRINLGLSRDFMNGIGDPVYDEFFASLRSHCDSDSVFGKLLDMIAVPLEGSRGCFAKCDFCQNPQITTQFRSMEGEDVARRALRLREIYRTGKVYFADSVCNSWAENYADTLLAQEQSITAFMEMRVHAPETFFTKLALAGVNELQLGVEAVSAPLLKAMNKGTTVWQNLRAAKYLSELGITSSSNLITHHPHSTVEDVAETARVMSELGHIQPFSLSQFVVSFASPIYNALPPERRDALPRGFTWLPPDLRPFSIQRDLAYPYPTVWLPEDVQQAWNAFRDWYVEKIASCAIPRPELLARSLGDETEIVDGRSDVRLCYRLRRRESEVLRIGHHAPKRAAVAEACGLSEESLRDSLAELRKRGLVLTLGERILSLPLRPKTELVTNLYSAPAVPYVRHTIDVQTGT